MKRKALKAMACAMSVCMLGMSLAGCGNNDSSTSSGSQGGQSSQGSQESQSSQGSEAEASQGGQSEGEDIGADRSGGLFPAYDFGGVELKVLDQSDLGGKNPDAEGLEDYVKAERQDMKDYIEAKYNVKLTFVPLPTGEWKEIRNEIVAAYNSGNPIADIMDAYYQFVGGYVANDILYDFSDDFAKDTSFKEDEKFTWKGKQWGISRAIGGEGLYYNADWVEELGMEKTPAEMFDEGRWSYDDCYQYLLDMKQKLGNDSEYPLFVAPDYWMLFAPAANGTIILDPSGNLNYNQDAFIEAMEFFQKCLNDNLIAVADKNEDGEYNTWNYPSDTYGQQNTIVMTHRAAWQADGDKNNFRIGFVPYPWGKNVTIDESKVGEPGAYLTLSDNYQSSCFDGQLLCFTKNITDKVDDPMQLMSMLLEWMGWESTMNAYVSEDDTVNCGWLEDGLDKDLYVYSVGRQRLEPYNSLKLGLQMHKNIESIMYDGVSIRSAMESYYNADMKTMIDNGYADESVVDDSYVEPEPETETESQ